MQHVEATQIPELGYPRCDIASDENPTKRVYEGLLQSGASMTQQHIVEHYKVWRNRCFTRIELTQSWPLNVTYVEAFFDPQGRPLWVWKQQSIPGVDEARAKPDIRRYDLRTQPITLKHRDTRGKLHRKRIRGPKPKALIGPGRGLLSAWIQQAQLEVGDKKRVPVLDVRGLELIKKVTLKREPNRRLDQHPKPLRVYTIYGREAVFTNANNWVIGDLQGLRPAALSQRDALLKTLPQQPKSDPKQTP